MSIMGLAGLHNKVMEFRMTPQMWPLVVAGVNVKCRPDCSGVLIVVVS